MPFPLAHTATAAAVFLWLNRKAPSPRFREGTVTFILLSTLANLPDLDFLPGFLLGESHRYHHGISHSIFLSLMAGLIAGLLFRRLATNRGCFTTALCLAAVSHPLLDYFSADCSFPFGVPLLWPFGSTCLISPVSLFMPIEKHGNTSGEFIDSLMNMHNARALFIEFLFSATLLSLCLTLAKKEKPGPAATAAVALFTGTAYYLLQIHPQIL